MRHNAPPIRMNFVHSKLRILPISLLIFFETNWSIAAYVEGEVPRADLPERFQIELLRNSVGFFSMLRYVTGN